MDKDVKSDEKIVEDLKDMTDEEKANAWMNWVKSEVMAVLNIYLPHSIDSNIGLKYIPHVVEKLETGDVIDDTKADAVELRLVFKFEKPIDPNKPRIEEEQSE